MPAKHVTNETIDWLKELKGWLGSDAYSTAWVALVPSIVEPSRPAWPSALDYLRRNQLEDGGWGEANIYFAHERTISTLAAIKAFHTWQEHPGDVHRIHQGLAALRRYAPDLAGEPHQPVGFEMLLPRLVTDLARFYSKELPLNSWRQVDALWQDKMAILKTLHPDPTALSAWWVSMEALPEEQLAQLGDEVLDTNGSISTSTAATAAYLRSKRLAGMDSKQAASYLDRVVTMGSGSVPFCWPVEILEQVWALDVFMRGGLDPNEPSIASVVNSVRRSWYLNEPGLSYSADFLVNDGDDTLLGYAVLNWSGSPPPDEPMLNFWNQSHFLGYLDERGASPSVNIHALSTLRGQPGFPHADLARKISDWLTARIKPDVMFDDKWQYSPFYSVAHAIPAFAGWDDSVAQNCIDFIIDRQRPDGGWGNFGYSTLEETAHCTVGLYQAHKQNLLKDLLPLIRAARFFRANTGRRPIERLWIGKTLYRPAGIVKATLFAAQTVLEQLGYATVEAAEYQMIA